MSETNQTHRPLSLRWKWGIFLSIIFVAFSTIAIGSYRYFSGKMTRDTIMANSQLQFEAMVDYIESLPEDVENLVSRNRNFQMSNQDNIKEDRQREAAYFRNYLNALEYDKSTFVRIYNEHNRIVYETSRFEFPNIASGPTISQHEFNHQLVFYGKSEILHPNKEKMGVVEVAIFPHHYVDIKASQNNLVAALLVVLIIAGITIAVAISRYFLRPLHYINNVLDLVEEENLHEIRVRRPKQHDEWSDLNFHINRLLDKIDLYVKNQKQFVEDVSHELRTPVAIVEGHLQMLNRWGKDDPDVLSESISASLQEIKRMKELVQEMLDLSRADHVDIDYKDEFAEVYSTVRQTYNNFVMLYPQFRFFLDSEKENKELFIWMYRNHLEQVLIILLDNAVKYSAERKEIHISVSQSITHVQIAVQDFGEGMTPEDKERVFGRFYRVDKARSREKGGNGLGLSIAKQLVEGYKGTIYVESVLGHGSIFYIEFPVLTDKRELQKKKQKALQKSL